jgi:hypothetical protein
MASTIGRAAAISHRHKLAGHVLPPARKASSCGASASKTDQEGQGQEIAIPRGYRLRLVEAVQTYAGQFL